jgi:hypothetical protein
MRTTLIHVASFRFSLGMLRRLFQRYVVTRKNIYRYEKQLRLCDRDRLFQRHAVTNLNIFPYFRSATVETEGIDYSSDMRNQKPVKELRLAMRFRLSSDMRNRKGGNDLVPKADCRAR